MKLTLLLIFWTAFMLVVGRFGLRRPAGPARVYLFIVCNGAWLTGLFWLLRRFLGGAA